MAHSPERRAVIDIGTNSVKLLVADVNQAQVVPVLEDSEQTRLGRGFYENHLLQPEPIAQTAEAVAKFARCAEREGAKEIRVIATSAARDARNPQALLAAIEQASGLRVEIISGEQEADWAFKGVIANSDLATHPLLLLDVGGGSTEFILGDNGHALFRDSFKLGTVRLFEALPHSDPPATADLERCRQWLDDFLRRNVAPTLNRLLEEHRGRGLILVGTGGTTTILSRITNEMTDYDRERIEGTRFSANQVRQMTERLWNLPLARRQQIVGLPAKRADVILTGVAIYEAVMREFRIEELRVSTRGLRFAAIVETSR